MVDCYAATPSTTSLKTLLLLGILQGHQTTCLDISTAFINTPLPETEEIYVQPPQEWYYDSPTTLWRLKKAMYGLRTSPKLWQLHLGRVLQQQGYDNARQTGACTLLLVWGVGLRGRLTTSGRDYKNRRFHHYPQGYIHIETCYYFVKNHKMCSF